MDEEEYYVPIFFIDEEDKNYESNAKPKDDSIKKDADQKTVPKSKDKKKRKTSRRSNEECCYTPEDFLVYPSWMGIDSSELLSFGDDDYKQEDDGDDDGDDDGVLEEEVLHPEDKGNHDVPVSGTEANDEKSQDMEETIELKPIAVKLLKKTDFFKKYAKLRVTFDSPQVITFYGAQQVIRAAQLDMHKNIFNSNQQQLCFSPAVGDILLSQAGQIYLQDKVPANVEYEIDKAEDRSLLHCLSFTSDLQDFKKQLSKEITEEKVVLEYSIDDAEGMALLKNIESLRLVRLSPSPGNSLEVTAEGIGDDVLSAVTELRERLKKQVEMREMDENFELNGTIAQFFRLFCAKETNDILKPFRKCGGKVDSILNDETGYLITLSGTKVSVEKTRDQLLELMKSIWHERIYFNKVAEDRGDVALLSSGVHSEKGIDFINSFEIKNKCSIEMDRSPERIDQAYFQQQTTRDSTKPKKRSHFQSESTEFHSEKSSTYGQERRTSRVPHGNRHNDFGYRSRSRHTKRYIRKTYQINQTKISVKKGDVTYEKADVLVNIVTEDLSLIKTRVSQSFMKKGGDVLKKNFEDKQSEGDSGQTIVTDENGKIPCKAVYHLPLEKWNSSSSPGKLQSLIQECFNKSKLSGMRTIVFPFVGTLQLLQYPVDAVLELMVSETKTALEKGDSTLKEVRFVFLAGDQCSKIKKLLGPFRQETEKEHGHSSYSYHSDRHQRRHPGQSRFHEDPRSDSRSRSFPIERANITVKNGDITDTKADVLVNGIPSDLNLKITRISQAFMKKGGDALVQDYQKQVDLRSASKKCIIITDQTGRLHCKYVYHIPLQKWCDASTVESLSKLIQECLNTASENSLSSIAFPMLGYGPTFNYSKDVAIECMVKEAVTFVSQQNCNITEILLVAYDPPIYQDFCNSLSRATASSSADASSGDSTSTESSSEDEDEAEEEDEEVQEEDDVTPKNAVQSIRLYAKDKLKCMQAKQNLETELRATFLFEDKISDDNISGLEAGTEQKIKGLCKNMNAIICIRKDKRCIYLKGEESTVNKLKSKVYKILIDSETEVCSGNKLLKAATVPIKAPKYWENFNTTISIQSLLAKIKDICKLVDIKTDNPVFTAISELVNKTWLTDKVGHGQDARNLTHKNIQITKIQRVENLSLYKKYAAQRQGILREAAVGKTIVPLEQIPNTKGPVLTNLASDSLAVLKPDIFPEINEYYLFHGTKPDCVNAIYSDGLDSRISNLRAMFGQGVYAAESSTKADQYADPKHGRTSGEMNMFLIRMTLGRILVKADADDHTKYRRAPCTDPQCHRDNCTAHPDRYHSVVADGKWIFREFIVYSPDQCYPEYLITYTRH